MYVMLQAGVEANAAANKVNGELQGQVCSPPHATQGCFSGQRFSFDAPVFRAYTFASLYASKDLSCSAGLHHRRLALITEFARLWV